MKAKSIITILILSVSGVLTVFAQEIKPNVVQEGRQWSFNRNVSGLNPELGELTGENLAFFLGADTVIDGKTYKDVLYKKVLYWDNFDLLPVQRRGTALREENQKLYHYDYALKTERILCDFSLQPGDTIDIDPYSRFRVIGRCDTVFYEGGRSHRYVKVEDRDSHSIDFWLEGIGSLSLGIEWGCLNCSGSDNVLLCCHSGDTALYKKTENCLLNANEATFVGKIVFVENPPADVSAADCQRFPILQTKAGQYVLMRNGVRCLCEVVIDGETYREGDNVTVQGVASVYMRRGGGAIDSELEVRTIKKSGVSVQPSQKFELKLTPNPAGETITLTATGCSLQKVEILDMNGRILYAATLDNQTFRYNVSWMPSGIYLARVKTPCGVLTEKFSVR
ncbi:MAG: T9SS type A sorting domain-containing protein [Bacteroides sp.]|nr:T9SS type A sorting domain-containing protein [Ruminococcus flavefaciens]MCM1554095.1 T9SS type A sorting domain-containing protein [Bacteroides sp.]